MTTQTPFEEAVRPYLKEVRQYCVYLTGSVWDGEDLLQETMARTFRYYKQRGEIEELRPFLLKVARNKRIDGLRKRRIIETSDADLLEAGRRDGCYFEIRGWLEWLTCRLPASQLTVWLLADYFGYTMNEIAAGLGLTMSAVRSQLFRARERLRACRPERGGEPAVSAAGARRRAAAGVGATMPSSRGRPVSDVPPYPTGVNPAMIERWARGIINDDPASLFAAARTGT